jgi:tripartite ATP-independent transporter DctP family solute receptor
MEMWYHFESSHRSWLLYHTTGCQKKSLKPLMNKESSTKRRLCLLLLVAVALVCGCDSDSATVATDKPVKLRMAHVYEVSAPTHAYGAAQLSERILEKTDDLEITVYPAAQLGSEAELLEQLVAGELDIAITGPSFLGMWHPPIGVLDAAFATRDLDHMLETARSDLMAPEWEVLREKYGVRVLDTWPYGSRHITSKVPIRHPDDLKGFRLRLPGARTYQASGEALGASPMPIAFSEVYLALSQGIADGQENPVPVIKAKGFHEVQDYLNLTGHIQSSIQILVNERTWNRLTADQQKALKESIQELGSEVHAGIIKDEKRLIEEWRKDGQMEIIEDVDSAAFRERCRKFFSKGFPFSEVYNRISAEPSEKEPSEKDDQ